MRLSEMPPNLYKTTFILSPKILSKSSRPNEYKVQRHRKYSYTPFLDFCQFIASAKKSTQILSWSAIKGCNNYSWGNFLLDHPFYSSAKIYTPDGQPFPVSLGLHLA